MSSRNMDANQLEPFFAATAVTNKVNLVGRDFDLNKVISIINKKGYHIIISGERGIGKSSLIKTANTELKKDKKNKEWISVEYKCTGSGDYTSVCSEVLASLGSKDKSVYDAPFNLVKLVTSTETTGYLIIDEFEMCDDLDKKLFSQLLKHLGEAGSPITLCFCEAIDIPKVMYKAHKSTRRYIEKIKLSGLSQSGTAEIVNKVLKLAGMNELPPVEEAVIHNITQGVPYRIKELGREIVRAMGLTNESRLSSKTFKKSCKLLLDSRYEDESMVVLKILKKDPERDLCGLILKEATCYSFFEFIDHNEIYKKLKLEYGGKVINKEKYLTSLNELVDKYKLLSKEKNMEGKGQLYFSDYTIPFIVRLTDEVT